MLGNQKKKKKNKSFVKSYEKGDFPQNHHILLSNPVKRNILGCMLSQIVSLSGKLLSMSLHFYRPVLECSSLSLIFKKGLNLVLILCPNFQKGGGSCVHPSTGQ